MRKKLHLILYSLLSIPYTLYPKPLHAWEGDVGDVATFQSIESLFGNIVSVVLNIIGLTTFVIILIGGFKYLTAAGDAKGTDEAKATITSGVLGLVLAIGAWTILYFIGQFTGTNLLQFNLIFPAP